MSNTIYTTGNALLWILMQVYLNKDKSNLIKDVHPVSDSNLNCEKVCINYINGDTIEFIVNDEKMLMHAILMLKQKEISPDKPISSIKGELTYPINKWPDEPNGSSIAAYLAKMFHVIKDVLARYETGEFTALCKNIITPIDGENTDWVKFTNWEFLVHTCEN